MITFPPSLSRPGHTLFQFRGERDWAEARALFVMRALMASSET